MSNGTRLAIGCNALLGGRRATAGVDYRETGRRTIGILRLYSARPGVPARPARARGAIDVIRATSHSGTRPRVAIHALSM